MPLGPIRPGLPCYTRGCRCRSFSSPDALAKNTKYMHVRFDSIPNERGDCVDNTALKSNVPEYRTRGDRETPACIRRVGLVTRGVGAPGKRRRRRRNARARASDGKLITELSLLIAIPAICAMAWRCSARDCRRVPNYWMLTSPGAVAAERPDAAPRALLVIAGTNYAISAAL